MGKLRQTALILGEGPTEFFGPSEKFRGWGKPIQSAKYRNYTIES